jgi:hypothetical protein
MSLRELIVNDDPQPVKILNPTQDNPESRIIVAGREPRGGTKRRRQSIRRKEAGQQQIVPFLCCDFDG